MKDLYLKQEEKILFNLRAMYKLYGYMPFKMTKFEEYDFYLRNKDFLTSSGIITFNDTDGRLLALKPDVTLSIVKNSKDVSEGKKKVFYNESVYRVSGSSQCYREIMQTGLECIGDVELYDLFEVLLLAAKSMALISDQYVLDVSHLGVLAAVLDQFSEDDTFRKEAVRFIAQKNAHDLQKLCEEYNLSAEAAQSVCSFASLHGDREKVLELLEPLCTSSAASDALKILRSISELLDGTSYSSHIRFDFSVVNDMKYYNGIVFKGFIDGVCESILSGGQYDYLMSRMGRKDCAIGFAVYLDLLEYLCEENEQYDVDVVLLYDSSVSEKTLALKVQELVENEQSVSVHRKLDSDIRYRALIDLREGETEC